MRWMRTIRVAVRVLRGDEAEELIPQEWQQKLGVPPSRWSQCPRLKITSQRFPNAVDLRRFIEQRLSVDEEYTRDELLQGLAEAYVDAGCAELWQISRQWLEHHGIMD